MESEKLCRLFNAFDTGDSFVSAKAHGNGHINDTYKITGESGVYTLQRINTHVFTCPEEVMENIKGVTEHIADKYRAQGVDPSRRTLRVIKTRDGGLGCWYDDGFYRMFTFVDDVVTYGIVDDTDIFYKAARAFGRFQCMLADYPAEKLHETIADFHNTPKRYENFCRAVKSDICGRALSAAREIEYINSYADFYGIVTSAITDGRIPLRVTHNDTKLDNILFDKVSCEGICIIDLDTVMPGSALYDYGDALRVGMNSGAEDSKDFENIRARIPMFRAFTRGYLEEVGEELTKAELELLPLSGRLLTLECAMRFLTDYLEGDVYFKTSREGHNLDRARVGIALAEDMRRQESEMKSITREIRAKLGI